MKPNPKLSPEVSAACDKLRYALSFRLNGITEAIEIPQVLRERAHFPSEVTQLIILALEVNAVIEMKQKTENRIAKYFKLVNKEKPNDT